MLQLSLAQLAWATGLACYTARAAENLRAQNLDYRCESVFRRDKLSDSAVLTTSTRVTSGLYTRTMGVASNLSVIRGNFQRTSAVGSSLSAVRNQEASARGRFLIH